ncbi:YppG family protein [Evansella vedderi]|nr:YppG family protein [Evansella vedderi]
MYPPYQHFPPYWQQQPQQQQQQRPQQSQQQEQPQQTQQQQQQQQPQQAFQGNLGPYGYPPLPPRPTTSFMNAFKNEQGKFDFEKTSNTIDQVVKLGNQISPIVKQVGSLFGAKGGGGSS